MSTTNAGVCAVDGCVTLAQTRGWCAMHYERWRIHGDPTFTLRAWGGGKPSPTLTYKGAHSRLRRERGKAAAHLCVQCGGRAQQWAYDHSDPAEMTGPTSAGAGNSVHYSMDPSHYLPMCKSCHKCFDLAWIRLSAGRASYMTRAACINGHARTPENTYIAPKGGEFCRACGRLRAREYQQRKRAERSRASA